MTTKSTPTAWARAYPPPGEVGPSQDGMFRHGANFRGAKMASSGREKEIGGQLRLGANFAGGGGVRRGRRAEPWKSARGVLTTTVSGEEVDSRPLDQKF